MFEKVTSLSGLNKEQIHILIRPFALGMAIPWRFSFLGDSRNRGKAISHSSGRKTNSIPRGPRGISGNIFLNILLINES